MATHTGIRGVVIISVVTGVAIIGYGYMSTREWIILIMIKARWYPGIFRVALSAIHWELLHYVVRIIGTLIIRRMTTYAGIGRVVVITIVTSCAVIRDRDMRPI